MKVKDLQALNSLLLGKGWLHEFVLWVGSKLELLDYVKPLSDALKEFYVRFTDNSEADPKTGQRKLKTPELEKEMWEWMEKESEYVISKLQLEVIGIDDRIPLTLVEQLHNMGIL